MSYKKKFIAIFEMVDIKPLAFYIGLKVTWDWEKRTIKLLQSGYIEMLLDCYNICKTKTAKVSMQNTILLPSNMLISKLGKIKYSAKVSSIINVIIKTYIDIAFAISMISKFAKNPSSKYFHAIYQILFYLARSQNKDIIFRGKEKLKLVKYLNLGWARNHVDSKSTSGFVFTLDRKSVSYASKRQAIVALSSTKAK